MKELRPLVWKEWREQRGAVYGLLAALPLLVLAIAWLPRPLGVALAPSAAQTTAACLLAALLAIGPGLLPADSELERRRFLERLPGGLAAAFRAKLSFFVLALLGGALYGAALGLAASFLARGGFAPLGEETLTLRAVLPGLGAGLWVFAVSAWVPRGPLAFAVGCVWIALLCWPAWLFYAAPSWFVSMTWEPAAFFGLCAVGSCCAARAAFVGGLRLDGGRTQAALRGVAVATLFLLPAWIWAGVRVRDVL